MLQKSVRNKTLQKNKCTKLISKSPDKTEENSGLGSRCFSSVFEGSLPKKFRSASIFFKRVKQSAICFAGKNTNALTINFLTK
ncbi:hypothetical protein EG348_06205 [Chryseobacterium sp. G0201]|nr:hypothetical protein EG348_06205 [Chryseobacterium sp. G0201]